MVLWILAPKLEYNSVTFDTNKLTKSPSDLFSISLVSTSTISITTVSTFMVSRVSTSTMNERLIELFLFVKVENNFFQKLFTRGSFIIYSCASQNRFVSTLNGTKCDSNPTRFLRGCKKERDNKLMIFHTRDIFCGSNMSDFNKVRL